MKAFANLFLLFSCVWTWVTTFVTAFSPSLLKAQKTHMVTSTAGLYRTISGLLGSQARNPGQSNLRMVAGYIPETSSTWWTSMFAKKPPPPPMAQTESNAALANLIAQSASLKRARKETFTYTNVAGFMEYDPKLAAAKAHKRVARESLHRGGRWFSL